MTEARKKQAALMREALEDVQRLPAGDPSRTTMLLLIDALNNSVPKMDVCRECGGFKV